jgi:uncharacterized protein (TIGR02391 family)
MASLTEAFPDAPVLVSLSADELGDVILELLHQGIGTHGTMLARPIFSTQSMAETVRSGQSRCVGKVEKAIHEAVDQLQHGGFIMFDPSQSHSTYWRTLTRKGKELTTRVQAQAYRDAGILPTGLVHPEILKKSGAAFLRGDHDIAVLSAFKTVEIAVRRAGGYEEGELGVKLMRKAFEVGKGPLTDKTLEQGEQQAQSDLFAGAIGAAKNPASHRDVEMSKPEAARLILFASYLLSIVDQRTA